VTGLFGVAAFVGVIALIFGFFRDPSEPFSTALKWFGIIFVPIAVWITYAAGMQR
jgi:hypothetical protein